MRSLRNWSNLLHHQYENTCVHVFVGCGSIFVFLQNKKTNGTHTHHTHTPTPRKGAQGKGGGKGKEGGRREERGKEEEGEGRRKPPEGERVYKCKSKNHL